MRILNKRSHFAPDKLDLSYINLSGEDLSRLDLSNIIFRNANLSDTVIKHSALNGSDLSGANLSNAVFICSYLGSTNLSKTNLEGALFYNTDPELALIDIPTMNKYFPSICPSEGEFIGWKKAFVVVNEDIPFSVIVKLLIPKDAIRTSAFGRKCRCDKARVLSINYDNGVPTDTAFSAHDLTFKYEIGKEVSVDNFDEDRRHECAPGIHFFMTREEAVAYPDTPYNNIAINIRA
jgi:hypothetical protein